jgi:eukaryotic-like serine/threonine-protein kinase
MSAIAVRADTSEPTTLGGRYRLLRRIGVGGMGTVWEAEDRVLRRRVAVKILAPALCDNPAIAERFRREAQAAGRLTHPNIAQVFDYGEQDGCPFIVLELVPGSTLRETIQGRGRLPAEEAASVGAQIAEALAAAHAEGIVHRDVKPGNVMMAPDGRAKVMDFGIADAVWFEPITDTGTVLATAKYISPEQATGGAATAASDVYSLGVVLYELLAGGPPFEGDSPFAVAHAHAHEPPPPLERVAAGAPRSLTSAVEAAMRKDPGRRPSASDLAVALRQAPAGDATTVLPFAGVEPTRRLVPAAPEAAGPSRRAALWVLGGMAALALVLTLALTAFVDPAGVTRRPADDRGPSAVATHDPKPPAPDAKDPKPKPKANEPPGKARGHDEGKGPGKQRDDPGHGPG